MLEAAQLGLLGILAWPAIGYLFLGIFLGIVLRRLFKEFNFGQKFCKDEGVYDVLRYNPTTDTLCMYTYYF